MKTERYDQHVLDIIENIDYNYERFFDCRKIDMLVEIQIAVLSVVEFWRFVPQFCSENCGTNAVLSVVEFWSGKHCRDTPDVRDLPFFLTELILYFPLNSFTREST